MNDTQRRNQGFATETYEVRLDDYHPGEYTHFLDWAERKNRLLKAYRTDDAGYSTALGTNPWTDMPDVHAELIEANWDNASEEELAEGLTDRWVLRGTANQLRELYHELLTQLVTPAWHWYGMGGDDNAFDYWPNSMILATEFRDQLLEIANHEPDDWSRPYYTTYIAEDLARVYWLCRERWERDEAKTVPGHEFPGTFDDFLAADGFGDRP